MAQDFTLANRECAQDKGRFAEELPSGKQNGK